MLSQLTELTTVIELAALLGLTELTGLAWLTPLTELTWLIYKVEAVDRVNKVDRVELSLAKPGGGEASPRGEASRESALPTSLLACPSGGWPLNLLEVRIVGTKVACNIRSWQYIVVKKLISSSFRMTVILLREVISPVGGVTLIYTAGAMVMVVLCLECPFPRSRHGTAARGTYPGRAMRKIKIKM